MPGERKPLRIASLLPSATEVLWALGLADEVVAVSHECDFSPAARCCPKATRSRVDSSRASGQIDDDVRRRLAAGQPLYALDGELLRRLRPDLIITQAQCDVCAVRLEDVLTLVCHSPELSSTTVLPLQPENLDDIFSDIQKIGRAAGVCEAAGKYVAGLQRRVDAICVAAGKIAESQRPRVVCIEWSSPLMTAGNWVPGLVEMAGGRCLLARAGEHSPYVSWESIREANPEVIVVAPCGFDLARTLVETEALTSLVGWSDLAAVQQGRVWAVDGNAYFNRSGPRIVDSLEVLAHVLHPERSALPHDGAIKRVL